MVLKKLGVELFTQNRSHYTIRSECQQLNFFKVSRDSSRDFPVPVHDPTVIF